MLVSFVGSFSLYLIQLSVFGFGGTIGVKLHCFTAMTIQLFFDRYFSVSMRDSVHILPCEIRRKI